MAPDSLKLNSNNVNNKLNSSAQKLFPKIEFLSEVTSTNDYLLHQSQQDPDNIICFAHKQTHGRGRRGHSWITNEKDASFSLLWNTDIQLDQLAGISLITALMVTKALEVCHPGMDFRVKWPNDIFYQNKKIGGILIESTKNKQATAVIIGIGINVANDNKKQKLKTPYTCLDDISTHATDPCELIANIVNNIEQGLTLFEQEGLKAFTDMWNQYDHSLNQEITVATNQTEMHGINRGINQNGELILSVNNNKKIYIHSGKIEKTAPSIVTADALNHAKDD